MGEVSDLIDFATEVTELIDKGGTTEELVEATTMFLRKQVYEMYPNFEPKVLEALILFYTETIYQMYEDIQGGVDIKAPIKDLGPEVNGEYNKMAQKIGKAFKKAVKKLSGEG